MTLISTCRRRPTVATADTLPWDPERQKLSARNRPAASIEASKALYSFFPYLTWSKIVEQPAHHCALQAE